MSVLDQIHSDHKARKARIEAAARGVKQDAGPVVKRHEIILSRQQTVGVLDPVVVQPPPQKWLPCTFASPDQVELMEPDRNFLARLPELRSRPHWKTVIRVVAQSYGISVLDMLSERRTAQLVRPRHVTMFLLKELTTASLPAIGRCLGNRDHTTILHGARKIKNLIEADGVLANQIAKIKDHFKAMGFNA